MKKFTANQDLSARSICNHDCIFEGKVIKRTAKMVTINTRMSGEKRVKIHIDMEGNEYCFPHGQHSMATIFRA